MLKEKIIFLDIDGVLNHTAFRGACNMLGTYFHDKVDPSNLVILKDLLKYHPDIKFVISSSWRRCSNVEKISKVFENSGFKLPIHERWRTPVHIDEDTRYKINRDYIQYNLDIVEGVDKEEIPKQCRGHEVWKWLMGQPENSETQYLIIDDDRDFMKAMNLLWIRNGENQGGINLRYLTENIIPFFNSESTGVGVYRKE